MYTSAEVFDRLPYPQYLPSYFILVIIGHFDPHETALRNPKIQPDVRTAFLLELRSVLNAFFTR